MQVREVQHAAYDTGQCRIRTVVLTQWPYRYRVSTVVLTQLLHGYRVSTVALMQWLHGY